MSVLTAIQVLLLGPSQQHLLGSLCPGNSRCFHSHLEDVNLLELSASFSFTEKRENVMHVLPLHGGHLGFFEGSVLFPEPLTWMDKLVVQYANAICQWEKTKPHCSDAEQAVSGQE